MNRDRESEAESDSRRRPRKPRGWVNRAHRWVFLTGNRMVVAAGLLGLLLAVTTAIELLVTADSQQLVPLFYMSSAIIGGNFTLITIVLSISQLVISRQLSAPGELQDQIRDTTDYRDSAMEMLQQETAPATPAEFLETLHEGVRHRIDDIQSHRERIADDGAVEAIGDVLEPLESQVNWTIEQLGISEQTTFEALVVTLGTNYSRDIHQIWRLQSTYDDTMSEEATTSLDRLVVRLKQIDVARQYLKTLYIQEELARLSRRLLYVGVPVVMFGLVLMQVFVSTDKSVLSPTQLSIVTPVFVTLGVAPLAVLFAFVLRLSVVSERTVAITPFTTPTQEESSVYAGRSEAEEMEQKL